MRPPQREGWAHAQEHEAQRRREVDRPLGADPRQRGLFARKENQWLSEL